VFENPAKLFGRDEEFRIRSVDSLQVTQGILQRNTSEVPASNPPNGDPRSSSSRSLFPVGLPRLSLSSHGHCDRTFQSESIKPLKLAQVSRLFQSQTSGHSNVTPTGVRTRWYFWSFLTLPAVSTLWPFGSEISTDFRRWDRCRLISEDWFGVSARIKQSSGVVFNDKMPVSLSLFHCDVTIEPALRGSDHGSAIFVFVFSINLGSKNLVFSWLVDKGRGNCWIEILLIWEGGSTDSNSAWKRDK
jgi:hypothetical protein